MSTHDDNDVVSLENLINLNQEAVDRCVDGMLSRGWIFVSLPKDLEQLALSAEQQLFSFFESGKDKSQSLVPYFRHGSEYDSDLREIILGYDAVHDYGNNILARESIRILSGSELDTVTVKSDEPTDKHAKKSRFRKWKDFITYPKLFFQMCNKRKKAGDILTSVKDGYHLMSVLKPLALAIDSALSQVTQAVSPALFHGRSLEQLGKDQNLCLFSTGQNANFALLEVAYYRNIQRDEGLRCAEHFDPGLFSLNVLDNKPGLQFKDAHGNWINAPMTTSCGVLWAGAAAKEASGDKVVPAMHRVVRDSTPRLSLWTEICTRNQIFLEDLVGKNKTFRDGQLVITNIYGDLDDDLHVVSIREGRVIEALKLVEQLKGVPFTKLGRKEILYNEDGEVTEIKGN